MPYGCENISAYIALECNVDKFTYNRIVAIGILTNSDKDFALPATWLEYTGTTPVSDIDDDMIVVKDTRGEYDGGAAEKGAGYGRMLEVVTGMKHKLSLTIEYNAKNKAFLDSLMKTTNAGVAIVSGNASGDELEIAAYPVSFSSKTPITSDLDKVREAMVEGTWSAIELPKTVVFASPADKRSVLDLFVN
jgi:hypothetical protein